MVCGLAIIGGLHTSAQNYGGMSSTSASWGNSGYVNNYYYGSQSAFQTDDNMFNYGETATQNMGSTSAYTYSSGTISTAASNIVAGSTLLGYEEETAYGPSRGRTGWAPPVTAPIGDGLWVLLLLAIGYGGYMYRKRGLRIKD